MSKKPLNRKLARPRAARREFNEEFKREAVEMLLDGRWIDGLVSNVPMMERQTANLGERDLTGT